MIRGSAGKSGWIWWEEKTGYDPGHGRQVLVDFVGGEQQGS